MSNYNDEDGLSLEDLAATVVEQGNALEKIAATLEKLTSSAAPPQPPAPSPPAPPSPPSDEPAGGGFIETMQNTVAAKAAASALETLVPIFNGPVGDVVLREINDMLDRLPADMANAARLEIGELDPVERVKALADGRLKSAVENLVGKAALTGQLAPGAPVNTGYRNEPVIGPPSVGTGVSSVPAAMVQEMAEFMQRMHTGLNVPAMTAEDCRKALEAEIYG